MRGPSPRCEDAPDVVDDAVDDFELARELADRDLNRTRLTGRSRPYRHVLEPTWAEVGRRSTAAWSDEVLRLDASAPVERLLAAVLDAVG